MKWKNEDENEIADIKKAIKELENLPDVNEYAISILKKRLRELDGHER